MTEMCDTCKAIFSILYIRNGQDFFIMRYAVAKLLFSLYMLLTRFLHQLTAVGTLCHPFFSHYESSSVATLYYSLRYLLHWNCIKCIAADLCLGEDPSDVEVIFFPKTFANYEFSDPTQS